MKNKLFQLLTLTSLLFLVLPMQDVSAKKDKGSSSISNKDLRKQVKLASKSLARALVAEIGSEGLAFTTLAVLPFKALDKKAKDLGVSSALAELFSNQLSSLDQIVSVERSRIEGVIKELNRAKKGELSAKGAAQAGKLLGARHVLVGSVTTMGAELQVTVRMVVSEIGEIVKAETMTASQKQFVTFRRDVVVTKSKIGAAIRSTLVPGWGQLYNGEKLSGYTTIIAAMGAIGTAGAFGYLGTLAEAKYNEKKASTVSERKTANAHYSKARIALLSYAAIWSYAIADAYVSAKSDPTIDLKGWSDLESVGLVLSGSF
jgi:TolB-like protein